MKRHFVQLHSHVAGIADGFELALRFITWANQLHGEPTAKQIQQQFNTGRATAYRWRAAWRAVRGVHGPAKEPTK